MGRELDRRDFTSSRATVARERELTARALETSRTIPGDHQLRIARMDSRTGNPAVVRSELAAAEPGNHVERALDHVRRIGRTLGFAATQAAEYVADSAIQRTKGGAVAVHLQQQYKGIPIFQATETVRFAPDGRLTETVGSAVTVAEDVSASPVLSVKDAVARAAAHVAEPQADEQGKVDAYGGSLDAPAVSLQGFEPKVRVSFTNLPNLPTVLEAGPFGDTIKASLVWFAMGEDLRLGWEVLLTMPRHEGQYRTIVDAASGEVLYCRQLMQKAAARGNVYVTDGGSPRRVVSFPRPLADYGIPLPADLPPAFPDDWVAVDSTAGNCVNAHLDDAGPLMRGSLQNNVVVFDPADAVGDEQKILNIFFYNCVMHDFFYLLGFTEGEGNFQSNNFGRGGVAADRVDARSYPKPIWGTANMSTPNDGLNPIMRMGLVQSTGRHTALDSSVVFHEFMHGVTNRLVGGPMNTSALEQPQSSGMGEGWGDYIACTINNSTVVGAWVVNRSLGIRRFAYDSSFPEHFGSLGPAMTDEHDVGEIWCATLLEMNRRVGVNLGVQLVVDSLKISPANPSFLDMRDAILVALDAQRDSGHLTSAEHTAAWRGVWGAFARFGMGPAARSNGASLSGIVADFNLPADPQANAIHAEASPNMPIPDNQTAGISSTLVVSKQGRVEGLTVSVDIAHTFIGDLHVEIETPDRAVVVLHNRSGGNAKNLVKTYSSDSVAALAALKGREAQGTWTLRVADVAAIDVGVLRRWSVDVHLESTSQVVREVAAPALVIPDNDAAGVNSKVSINRAGLVKDISVGIDITHTYIGDLRVTLVAPSGKQAILHNRTGGDHDNLITTFTAASHPELASLVNEPTNGDWLLRVSDLEAIDTGKLNQWSIEITIA